MPLTLIADNAAGHLMQHGKVDLVIVGSDRTTIAGDVANKIGTYMKAIREGARHPVLRRTAVEHDRSDHA